MVLFDSIVQVHCSTCSFYDLLWSELVSSPVVISSTIATKTISTRRFSSTMSSCQMGPSRLTFITHIQYSVLSLFYANQWTACGLGLHVFCIARSCVVSFSSPRATLLQMSSSFVAKPLAPTLLALVSNLTNSLWIGFRMSQEIFGRPWFRVPTTNIVEISFSEFPSAACSSHFHGCRPHWTRHVSVWCYFLLVYHLPLYYDHLYVGISISAAFHSTGLLPHHYFIMIASRGWPPLISIPKAR